MKKVLLLALFFFPSAFVYAQSVTGSYDSFDGSGFTGDPQRTWIFNSDTGANVCGDSIAVYSLGGSWTALTLGGFGADSTCSDVLADGNYRAWSYSQYAGYDGNSYCGGTNDLATCDAYMTSWPSGYVAYVDFTIGTPPPPSPASASSTAITTSEAIIWVGSIIIVFMLATLLSSLILMI